MILARSTSDVGGVISDAIVTSQLLQRAPAARNGVDLTRKQDGVFDLANVGELNELATYFTTVIDWASGVFAGVPDSYMRGLDWGRLYEQYGSQPYDGDSMRARADELLDDDAVENKRGVYEYLLGGEEDTRLLNVRLFDKRMADKAYKAQTAAAKAAGVSNCPDCAASESSRRETIHPRKSMDADHVTPWSLGGETSETNLVMLCGYHNRLKGNR